uniref:hypothetical protein n=1 Tax=Candidatus Roseilinea sp. TaxID=2838777 RepID=UPI00404A17D1
MLDLDEPALALASVMEQDVALQSDIPNRYPASLRTRQQRPSAAGGYQLRHTAGVAVNRRAGFFQTETAPIVFRLGVPHAEMARLSRFARLLESDGIRFTACTDTTQTETTKYRRSIRLLETATQAITASTRLPHTERIYTRNRREIREQEALSTADWLAVGHHTAARDTWTRLSTFQTEAMWPLPGRWVPCYEPPSMLWFRFDCRNPIPPGLPAIVTLPLCCAPRLRRPWVPPPLVGPIIIPIRRIYRVRNTLTLIRVRDEHPIDVSRLSLSLDAGAWTWAFSATMPAAMLPLIQTTNGPEDLLATINGESIRLRIDQISRSRSFGEASLSVSGRGRAAVLASPVAPTLNLHNTEARTAQQLLIDALTDNGVPIGWTVDWQLEDWNVPAGAWNLTGTYIDAAKRIAEAGGGYVQGHDTDQVLIIRPYYPVAPWLWGEATPDLLLPEDVCRTEGIEWRDAADYNAVWITGGAGGRRDRIRRAGTAGDKQAQTIVDALATDAIMTRQRGIRVLGDTGRQAWITVSLPVLEETGLIRPGKLIKYSEQGNNHLGISRSLSVECQFPTVWQSIKLETHP